MGEVSAEAVSTVVEVFTEAEVTAVACTPELASALALQPGDPVIVLEELFFADDDLPLAWNTNYLIPGRTRFELLRKVPRRLEDSPDAEGLARPRRKVPSTSGTSPRVRK